MESREVPPLAGLLGAFGAFSAAGIAAATAYVVKRIRQPAEDRARTRADAYGRRKAHRDAAAAARLTPRGQNRVVTDEGKDDPSLDVMRCTGADYDCTEGKVSPSMSGLALDVPEIHSAQRSAHLAPVTPRQEASEGLRSSESGEEDLTGNAFAFWSEKLGTSLPSREQRPHGSSGKGPRANTLPTPPLTPELEPEATRPPSASFKASMERFVGMIEQQGAEAYVPRFDQRGRVAAVNTSGCKVTSKRRSSTGYSIT